MSADLATSTRLRSPNILTLEYSDASPLAHQWAKELQGKRNKLKHVFIRDLRRLVKFDQTDESMWVFLWAKVAEAMLQQTKNSDQTVMLDLINSLASATGTEMLSPSFSRDILRLTQSVREVASKFLKLSNDSDSSETFCGVAVLIDDKSDSDGRIRQALSDRYDRQDGVQTSDREDEDDVNSLLPITSDELGVKYAEIQPFIDSTFAYHDRQVAMAEVLYKRVLDIYQFHFKKDPKDIFNAVEFRIYTAKFKTLEMQTRSRVMNADAGLIPRVLSSGDAEQVSKYCKKRVRMYSLDQKSNAFFEEFKKEVEDNPKTLYIVVADECHWDITGGDQAHNLLINEWITRGKEVLNVFVVQVSATPYNVLTVDSRLPDVPLSSLVTSEDTERELHVADWSESDAGQDYSVCKLMVTCSAPNKWLGIGHDGKLETCRQDLASSFRFQRQGTSLTEIWTHEENPRVVRAHRIPGTARYEIKVAETDPDENQLPFEIVHEFGVGIIAIRFRVSDQWLYWCVSETGVSALNSTAKITAQPRSRMTVKRTMMMPSKFNFLVMEQERSVDGLTDQAANTVYVSLNYYFNSMSDPKTSRLRADPFLQEVVRKLEKDTQTAQPVDILAADYAYHFLVMASSYANSFVTQEGGIIAGDSLGHSKLLDKLISKFEAKLPPNQPLQEAFRLLRDEVQRNVQERFEEILATIDKRLTSNQQSGTIRFSSVNELEDSLGTELAHQFVNSLYAVALYRVANVDSNPNSSDGIAETVQFLKAKRTFRNSELLEWLASKGLQGLINDLNVAKGHDVMVGETGKVVFDLFRSCFDAGKPIQGEMIVVRVLRIQDGELFRDALMTARNVALQHTGVSGFVVLCDYGNVKKKNVSHAKEGKADKSRSLLFQVEQQHPRLFDCLQRRRCNTEIGEGAQCPCHAFSRQNEKLKCSNCLHVHRRIDQYEQLQNVPSILILAGRGRMGNTFPSSFTCLDLRVVRKEGQHLSMTLSTLAQELGTLCRYSEIRDTDYKPYALLSGALFSVLQEHRKRNSSFFALDLPAPDKHMKEKSDCFEMLKKLEQRKQSCQHFHETTVGSLRWYDHKAGENSYDFRHTNDQLILKKNRLVFQAEPQIGKTGVYLYLIRLLKQRIGVEEALESPFLDVDFVLNSSESTSDREATNKVPPEEDWLYPSFKQLETAKPLTELDVQPRTYGRDTGLPVNLSLENRKETVAKLQSDAGYEQLQHSQREMTAQAEWLPSDKEFHTNTFRASRVSHRTGCKVCSSKLARLAPPDVFESVTLSEIGPVTVSCPKSEIYAKPKRFLCGDEELSSLNYGTLNNPDENGVRFWIFNPSYKRSTKALLNYRHVMVSDDQKLEISYIQAIVVRSCEFEVYVKYWGRTHMIVQLPDSLKLPTELKQATGLDTADQQGGVGYSRLFIQLFAAALKLDFVFMLDDNIPYFAEIDFEKMSEGIWPGAFLPVKYCPFAKCLRHLQTQMDATAMRRQALPGSDEDTESLSGEDPESLTTYTGPPSRYAVVGILCKRPVSRTPFKRTPVCSVSLLNVEATIDKRVFYTPVCVREDLMFNYDCESQNLWVCKYSRFIHAKCQFVDWRKPLLFKWEESTSITSESSLTYDFPKNEATALIGFVSEVVPNYSRAFVGQMSYLDWGGSLRDVADKELVKLYLDDIRAACPGEGSTGGCGRSLVVLPLFFTHGHACGSQFLKTCIEREIKSNTGSETDNFLFLLPAKVLKDVELTTRRQITEFFTEKLFCGVSAGDFSVLTFRDPTKSAVGVVIVQVSQPEPDKEATGMSSQSGIEDSVQGHSVSAMSHGYEDDVMEHTGDVGMDETSRQVVIQDGGNMSNIAGEEVMETSDIDGQTYGAKEHLTAGQKETFVSSCRDQGKERQFRTSKRTITRKHAVSSTKTTMGSDSEQFSGNLEEQQPSETDTGSRDLSATEGDVEGIQGGGLRADLKDDSTMIPVEVDCNTESEDEKDTSSLVDEIFAVVERVHGDCAKRSEARGKVHRVSKHDERLTPLMTLLSKKEKSVTKIDPSINMTPAQKALYKTVKELPGEETLPICRHLLKYAKPNIEQAKLDSPSLLMTTLQGKGSASVARFIIESSRKGRQSGKGFYFPIPVGERDSSNRTVLHLAVSKQMWGIAKLIYLRSPNMSGEEDEKGKTPSSMVQEQIALKNLIPETSSEFEGLPFQDMLEKLLPGGRRDSRKRAQNTEKCRGSESKRVAVDNKEESGTNTFE